MSNTDMHTIGISKKCYRNLLGPTKETNIKYPSHVEFIRHMDFMKFWPCEVLLTHPGECYQKYFTNGVVLTKDSTQTDHIYVVRSGTCVVYMYVEETKVSWRDLLLKLIHPMINRGGLPGGATGTAPARVPDRPSRLHHRFSAPNLQATDLASVYELHPSAYTPPTSDESLSFEDIRKDIEGAALRQNWPLNFLPKPVGVKRKDEVLKETTDCQRSVPVTPPPSPTCSTPAGSRPHSKQNSQLGGKRACSGGSCWERRTTYRVPPECTPPKPGARRQERPYTAAGPPVYVEIETLQEGGVFGLDQIEVPGWVKRKSGKVALVSKGAEVIVLSKPFYTIFSTPTSFGQVLRAMRVYPSQESVQARYKLHLAWRLFSNKVVDEFFHDLERKGRQHFGLYLQDPLPHLLPS